jgi:hypothetical protein
MNKNTIYFEINNIKDKHIAINQVIFKIVGLFFFNFKEVLLS